MAETNADAGKDQESPQVSGKEVLSEEVAEGASNLMRWPVQKMKPVQTTSACVGWDDSNIENRRVSRKEPKRRL